MEFSFWAASIAGIIGGVLKAASRFILKKVIGLDFKLDLMDMWGTMVGLHGIVGRVAGNIVHLIASVGFAVMYAMIFDLLEARDKIWLWGLAGGFIHWIIGGFFMSILPMIHKEIPEKRQKPGAFVKNYGVPDIAAFLTGHLIYGISFGIAYDYYHAIL